MIIRNILPYIKKSFCGGIILGTVVCTLGISKAWAGICFLPNGEECKSEFSVSSDACKDWSEETRNETCKAKNGYFKQEKAGYNCESAVKMGDVCCPGWYYCTEKNCQDQGFKERQRKTPESAYVCSECQQGDITFYKCEAKPCNYDPNNPSASTLDDECTNTNGKYCLVNNANCTYDAAGTKDVYEWKADDNRRAGKQKCGTCVKIDGPCSDPAHCPRCSNPVWEENLPSGCVTCTEAGSINGKPYFCCEEMTEYPIPSDRRVIGEGACHQYEGPVVATGKDKMNCYKEVDRDCGNDNQYLTSSAEGCYCRDYIYDFDADPTLLKFNAAGEAPETGDTVTVTSTRAHSDGSNLEKNKYEILSNDVASKTGCQLVDDTIGTIQVSCRKNARTEEARACFVVRHVHTVTALHPELSKEICIEVEGDKCPGDLVINTSRCGGNDKPKLSETKSVSGENSCYECLDDSCPDDTWTKCQEEGKDCRPNIDGYDIAQTKYGNYCYKAKTCEEPLVAETEIPAGKKDCYNETAARSGDETCFKPKDPLEECKIEDGKVWDEEKCDCVDAECEAGFSTEAQEVKDCGEHDEGFTLTLGTNPEKSGDKLCTKCEANECSEEFSELADKGGNWNCTGEGHICYEGDTAKYNCTCDKEDADCGEGKKINKETCECEINTCSEGSVTPTPGCYICDPTGKKSVDADGNAADCLKCRAIEEYTVAEANKLETKCYSEDFKEGADGTKCFKELESCDTPCEDCVPGPLKPGCFNAIWGEDAEGTNMWTTADGQIFYKKVPVNPCTTNDGNLLYKGEGYVFSGEPDCSCAISQCPVEEGYYDVAPQDGKCYTCKTEIKDGKECLKCDVVADVVPESEKADNKCYEEVEQSANGTKCFKEKECDAPCTGCVGPNGPKPICFNAIWGEDAEGVNMWTTPDGTKYYKEVPENPCTSKDPDIKLDPRGYNDIHPGEPGYPANGADIVYQFYYTKWAPDENCSCKLEECPWPTRSKEEARQDWGECRILIQITTKEKHGFDCYTYDVNNALYGVTEENKVEGKCYDDGVVGDFGVKCYREVECGCPEGTSSAKPNACYDKYADEAGLRAKEVTLDNGTVCYPQDEPKCDVGEYDYTECKCAISSCPDEKALEYDGIPEVCRECRFTGYVTSEGKQCWLCYTPESGFTASKIESSCVVSEPFNKFDENGAVVATTTCYKEGEEEVTDAECVLRVVGDKIDDNASSVSFKTIIRAKTQCKVEGSEPITKDIELPDGTFSASVVTLDCEGGRVSYTKGVRYNGTLYTCEVDKDYAPNCPNYCGGEDELSANFPTEISPDGGTYQVTFKSVWHGMWGDVHNFRYDTADNRCSWMEHTFDNGYDKSTCTKGATIKIDEYCDENGDEERSVTVLYFPQYRGGRQHPYLTHTYTQKNKCKSNNPDEVCAKLNADGYTDSFKPKSALNITKTDGWTCQTVGGTECCAPKKCQSNDMIAATSTFDLTPYVDNSDNCVSYKSTNPKTYSGEDECLKESSFNLCPNSAGAHAYESEAEAKAACGTEVEIAGDIDVGCGEKSYTCYKCVDLPTYCRNLNENYVAEDECTAGCQVDRKTLRTCKPVAGTKCVEIVDEECSDNQKCDGSQNKCVDELPEVCDQTFDGWTFEGEYVINTTACSPNTCENCVATGQTIQDGSKCYAHTKNPEDGWTVGAGTGELCATTKNFTAGTMSFPCYKLDQTDDTPLCFIEDVVPEVSQITASTKEIKYKRNVRMLHICHSDGKQKLGDEILQSEPNTLNFPGFNDTTCENGKLVRLAADDTTHYNGKLLECKLATNIQINCPKPSPEVECPKRGEYATEAACKADLGSGCNGNKPITCAENTVNDLTCYKKTEGDECTGVCVDGQCTTCQHGKAPRGFACCETAENGKGWSTKQDCINNNNVADCEEVPTVEGSKAPTEGCWIPVEGIPCSSEYKFYDSNTKGGIPNNLRLVLSYGHYDECGSGNNKKYKCSEGYEPTDAGGGMFKCASGGTDNQGSSGGQCAYVRCVNRANSDMYCEWYVPGPNFTEVTVRSSNGRSNTVKSSDMRSGASGTYATTGAPGSVETSKCQFYPYGDLVSFSKLAGPCKIGTEYYNSGTCGECKTTHCDGGNNTQPETKSVTEKCPEGSCTKADGAEGTGIIAGYANGEPCYQEQACTDDGSSQDDEGWWCDCSDISGASSYTEKEARTGKVSCSGGTSYQGRGHRSDGVRCDCWTCDANVNEEECICYCPNGYWHNEHNTRYGVIPGGTGENPLGEQGTWSDDSCGGGGSGECDCPTINGPLPSSYIRRPQYQISNNKNKNGRWIYPPFFVCNFLGTTMPMENSCRIRQVILRRRFSVILSSIVMPDLFGHLTRRRASSGVINRQMSF